MASDSTTASDAADVRLVLSAAVLVALSAFWQFAVRANLSPVYGSIPVAKSQAIIAVIPAAISFLILGSLQSVPLPARKALASICRRYLALLAAACSLCEHLYLQAVSSSLGPEYGPTVSIAACWSPLAIMSYIAAFAPLASPPARLGLLLGAGNALEYALSLALTCLGTDSTALFTRWGLLAVGIVFYALVCPMTVKQVVPLLALGTLFIFQNPHSPLGARLVNAALEPHGFAMLERVESATGYVSVLENRREGFRALRCDHSLLGGDWLLTPQSRANGMTVAEPIYPVFTMLEAVRLMHAEEVVPQQRQALVM